MKVYITKYILAFLILLNVSYSQDILQNEQGKKLNSKSMMFKKELSKADLVSKEKSYGSSRSKELRIFYFRSEERKKNEFDLINSLGSNFNFGGFWENYAVLNFTPQISIRPTGFISIYANQNLNCLIPISSIKEYTSSLLIQSAAILAVENSFKLILNNSQSWITEIISFATKNLLLNLIIKPAIKVNSDPPLQVLQYENYYYSMSISF